MHPDIKYEYGYILIALPVLYITVNVGIMMYKPMRNLIFNLRKRLCKITQKRALDAVMVFKPSNITTSIDNSIENINEMKDIKSKNLEKVPKKHY